MTSGLLQARRVKAGTTSASTRTGARVVVCGTFHRDLEGLSRDYEALIAAGCHVLSPADVRFVAEVDGFVLAEHEAGDEPHAIERRHLQALQQADMIWLHAPEGYVGISAALELGVAHALGVPVLARERPADTTLRQFVSVVPDPADAVRMAATAGMHTPAAPLKALQLYYARIALERGYQSESPQDAMLLLTEEVGELARAVRKQVGLGRSSPYRDADVATELADVQLYVLHLANVLDVQLAVAVHEKERLNAERAEAKSLAA